ncbi:MAG TPA: hypothetical protein VN901_16410, partial [Candidatus Acidoferrales bacterium]|nr:hypothetical protein [Candidatus Acidoferrales bacterium]
MHCPRRIVLFALLVAWEALASAGQSAFAQAVGLNVDLTDAARNIYHAKLRIAAKPGAMTFVFPEWIPGNHRPSGP